MAGCKHVEAKFAGFIKKQAEFDISVALHAGVGRSAPAVLGHKASITCFCRWSGEIKNKMLDAQVLGRHAVRHQRRGSHCMMRQ